MDTSKSQNEIKIRTVRLSDFEGILPLWRESLKIVPRYSPIVRPANIHLFDEALRIIIREADISYVAVDTSQDKIACFGFRASQAKADQVEKKLLNHYKSCLEPDDFHYYQEYSDFIDKLHATVPDYLRKAKLAHGILIYVDPAYRGHRLARNVSFHQVITALALGQEYMEGISAMEPMMDIVNREKSYEHGIVSFVGRIPFSEFSQYHRLPNHERYSDYFECYYTPLQVTKDQLQLIKSRL